MCGICGLVSLQGTASPDPATLWEMNDAMVHRGPDSAGAHLDGPVGLAARRLSIIDLPGGDQPIANENGRVQVVHNGEIYNHGELRRELEGRGHAFCSRSDTEVLVHLYEEEGVRLVEKLRGMFAFALWDAGARRLVLARDRFGIKPLYYRVRGEVLSFSSELKALSRQPGFSRELDLGALETFLAFNSIPAPFTIFKEARKLPAGYLLVWEQGGEVRLERYARPRPVPAEEVRAEDSRILAEELRRRLRDSVNVHLLADVPVGVLLSGGVDSSALVALAATETSKPVSTFSIGFEERSFDELGHARLVAERYGTDHHELVVSSGAAQRLPELASAFDEPFADSSALPTFLVSELAASSVKVALSGEGSDELFGGYYTYVADLLAPRLGPAATALRRLVEKLPSSSRKASFDYKAKRFARGAGLPPLERHHAWKEIFSAEARGELVAPWRRDGPEPRDRVEPLSLLRRRYAETAGAEPLARLQDVDLGVYLPDDLLVKTDRASMAHSLETRVPFLDIAVAELALALPTHMKVRRLAKKRLLRKALAPLVPAQILRARKQGFSIPAARWLRAELEPLAREALSPEVLRRQGVFRPEAGSELIDAHVSGGEDLSRQIWGLLSFSLWFERHGSGGDGSRPSACAQVAAGDAAKGSGGIVAAEAERGG